MATVFCGRRKWRITGLFILAAGMAFIGSHVVKFYRRMPVNPLRATFLYFNSKVHAAGDVPAYTIYMTERATSRSSIVRDGMEVPPFNRTVTARKILARRADGSTADYLIHDTQVWPTDRAWDDSTIVDLDKHHIIHLFMFLRSKTTYPFHVSRIRSFFEISEGATAESDCFLTRSGKPVSSQNNVKVLGHEQILGFDTLNVNYDEGFDSQAIHHVKTVWLGTSLGCATVKSVEVQTNASQEITYATFHDPDRIILGEPDVSLFEPTAEEVKPSEELRRRKQYFLGRNPTAAELSAAARNDKKYVDAQQFK